MAVFPDSSIECQCSSNFFQFSHETSLRTPINSSKTSGFRTFCLSLVPSPRKKCDTTLSHSALLCFNSQGAIMNRNHTMIFPPCFVDWRLDLVLSTACRYGWRETERSVQPRWTTKRCAVDCYDDECYAHRDSVTHSWGENEMMVWRSWWIFAREVWYPCEKGSIRKWVFMCK